ncbi:MAG: DNA alkylation repair protein [bacterium]|nr:DNA alkylation repair protein [bacterium]
MTPDQFARRAVAELRAVKLRSAPPAGYLGTTKYEVLGVYTRDVERIGRELASQLPEDWIAPLIALRAHDIFEAKVLATDIAVRKHKLFAKSQWPKFSRWLEDCEGWALVDNLSCDVLSAFLTRWPELVDKTAPWTRSKNLWKRRAGLVVLVRPARTGQFADELFERMAVAANDHDPMIYKAVSWALRSLISTHRSDVEQFLINHESVLKSAVIREVRTKLTTGKKAIRTTDSTR